MSFSLAVAVVSIGPFDFQTMNLCIVLWLSGIKTQNRALLVFSCINYYYIAFFPLMMLWWINLPYWIALLWQWAPCHAVIATPLLIAFELLLCIYLESLYGMLSSLHNYEFPIIFMYSINMYFGYLCIVPLKKYEVSIFFFGE